MSMRPFWNALFSSSEDYVLPRAVRIVVGILLVGVLFGLAHCVLVIAGLGGEFGAWERYLPCRECAPSQR